MTRKKRRKTKRTRTKIKSPVKKDHNADLEKSSADKLLEAKEIQYYTVLVENWFSTRMEKDKSLLTLSSAGVALIVTLLTTVGIKQSFEIYLYILAVLCFLAAIILSIYIFDTNSKYLENVINEKNTEIDEKKLKWVDKCLLVSFLLGIVFLVIIGVNSSLVKMNQGDINMSNDKPSKNQSNPNKSGSGDKFKKSFTGVSKISPTSKPTQGQTGSSGQGQSGNSGSGSNSSNSNSN